MSNDRPGLPSHFRFAFENYAFKDVVAFSRDHLCRIAYMEIEPQEGDKLYRIGMEGRLIGKASSARMWASAGKAIRNTAHLAMGGNENLLLVMPLTVPGTFARSHGREITCSPGEVFVLPGDEPFSLAYGDDCTQLCLTLPRSEVQALEGRMMSAISFEDAPGLSLLKRYGEMLISGEELPLAAEMLATDHLRDLAIMALGTTTDAAEIANGHSVRAARLAAIKADIKVNLARTDLSAEWIALRQGISPQYVRILFNNEGTTFRDHVLNLRLTCVHNRLTDPRFADRRISTIAYEVGFSDLSYFNRTFRRRYGMTPSDARAPSLHPGQPDPS